VLAETMIMARKQAKGEADINDADQE